MTTRYTFDNAPDYFNAVLSSATTSTTYTTHSFAYKKRRLDSTTITASDGTTAVAHWKDKESFQLHGGTYNVDDIGKNETIMGLHYGRRWNLDGEQYLVGYDLPIRTWKIFRIQSGTPDEAPIAIFHEFKSKALNKSELPAIIVEPDVSGDEFLTVLLLLLWSRYSRVKEDAEDAEITLWSILGIFCCAG